ncbi:MAG: GtrA family protein [Bacteroidia bacterium]|nr:GtrA family protein [Bacteroidia bacterium]
MLILSSSKLLFYKFIKFCVVGATGMIVDFGITYLLKEKAKLNKFLANSAGFTAAASSNYFLNRIWTFHSTNPKIGIEYTSFLLVSVVGLGINNFVLWILTNKLKWNFYFSKLIAIIVTTIWNFIANLLITFSNI